MKLITIVAGFVLIMSTAFVYAAGEKGGTEDINIGIGELQHSSGETQAITEQSPAKMPRGVRGRPGAVEPDQKARATGGAKPKRKGNVETEWKVEKGEK